MRVKVRSFWKNRHFLFFWRRPRRLRLLRLRLLRLLRLLLSYRLILIELVDRRAKNPDFLDFFQMISIDFLCLKTNVWVLFDCFKPIFDEKKVPNYPRSILKNLKKWPRRGEITTKMVEKVIFESKNRFRVIITKVSLKPFWERNKPSKMRLFIYNHCG